jgi:light-regulated signal transduction histidine kinase (bacteriophytochrome)
MDNVAPTPIDQGDQEFEQFVCSACHNLRESLREIRLRAELTPGSQIEDQVRAMELLLDGMVEYAVVCAGKGQYSRVEMKGVLSQTLVHLDKQIQESGAVVTLGSLPAVMGDAGQLAAVMRHLLENALRFRGEAAPLIHVAAKRVGPQWVLSVHDNGPGIELRYRERVFLPFKRLHPRSVAGNGLGLAICKKLIDKHDGKIWVESEPEGGTTILFSLPAAN